MRFGPPSPLQSMMSLLGCGSSGTWDRVVVNLSATAGDRQVSLAWDDDALVATWEVWHSTDPDFAEGGLLVNGLTDPAYVHNESWSPGVKVYYWVRAVTANGAGTWAGPVNARAYVVVTPLGSVSGLELPQGAPVAWTWGTILFMTGEPPNGTLMGNNGGPVAATYDAALNIWEGGSGDITNDAILATLTVEDVSGNGFTFWNTDPP